MLVTQETQCRNQWQALVASLLTASAAALLGWLSPALWLLLGLSPFAYWWVRRRCLRRMAVMQRPFPDEWEKILRERVTFFTALDDAGKVRFRQLVQVFLDEVRITGIRTEVDDTIRMLVAASAVIPIFGFHDWEYRRLREVLIYPDAFDDAYRTSGGSNEQILGMVGLHHLSGVMILSKPALFAGFAPQPGAHNVGVHEFAHLVEKEAGEYGLPPEVPWMAVRQWVRYVARELTHPSSRRTRISAYAYERARVLRSAGGIFLHIAGATAAPRSRFVRTAAGPVSPGHGSPALPGARAPPGDRPQRALPLRKRQEIQTLLSGRRPNGQGVNRQGTGCAVCGGLEQMTGRKADIGSE
jgi:Mlc titration factor MtfA (ptsG expression regulator)